MKITMAVIHRAFCKARGIKYVAKNISKDLAWNCHEVATRIAELLEAEGVEARAVYGFYHGTCVGRESLPFHRHGWTVVDDTEIWDATRWVFEGVEPYLFKGNIEDHPEYDEGMRVVKNQMRAPFPKDDKDERTFSFAWSKNTSTFLSDLFGGFKPKVLTRRQAMWLANYDFIAMKDHIDEIYSKLIEADLEGFIPIDNFKWWENRKKKAGLRSSR